MSNFDKEIRNKIKEVLKMWDDKYQIGLSEGDSYMEEAIDKVIGQIDNL